MNSTNTLIQCATISHTETYQKKSTIFKANKTHIDTKVWCLLCAKDKEISREGEGREWREGKRGERGRGGERERERDRREGVKGEGRERNHLILSLL